MRKQRKERCRHYYKRIARKIWEEGREWARDQIVVALVLVVLATLVSLGLGFIHLQEGFRNVVGAVLTYSAALFIFVLYLAFRAPWLLDDDRQGEMDAAKEGWATKRAELEAATSATKELLEAEIKSAKDKIEQLTWPPDRPQVMIAKWGTQKEQEEGKWSDSEGFYVTNSGRKALDVKLDRFLINGEPQKWGQGMRATTVEKGGEGFIPILVESDGTDLGPFGRRALMPHLERAHGYWCQTRSEYEREYKISISLIYHDFDDLYFRTWQDMIFDHYGRTLRFESFRQEKLG